MMRQGSPIGFKLLSVVLLWCITLGLFAQNERCDTAVMRWMSEEHDVSFSHDNGVVLLESGQAKFDDLFTAIKQAKHSVHLEYFNFRNDSIANALFALLEQKVAEGIKVRVLFDGFGNDSNNKPLQKKHIHALRRKGIAIYEFDPVRFPWINHAFHRDHRKIVVIDNCVAYTGGMNVADYYIKGTDAVGTWRDLHVRVTGSAVHDLQAIFCKLWVKVSGEVIEPQALPQSSISQFVLPQQDTTIGSGTTTIGVVNREPRTSPKIIREAFVKLIDAAQYRLQLVNPYPTMNRRIRRALTKAVKRGVKVEFMVSVNSDIPLTPDLVNRTMYKLMRKGVDVYYYTGGFHHTKLLLADHNVAFLGSANLNARSLRYDYECNLLICDSLLVQRLHNTFERDKVEHCFLLTPERWKEFPLWRRFVGKSLYWLTPFVMHREITNSAWSGMI